MRFRDSHRLENAINSARNEARDLSDENQARLAQLMTVWASGYLEAACRDILGMYAERRADPSVARFVSRNLNRFNSPKMGNIIDLVRAFDEKRATELERFVEGRIKESVNSLVGIRNQIAHGRPTDTTVGRIAQQFEDAKKLAGKLEDLFQ